MLTKFVAYLFHPYVSFLFHVSEVSGRSFFTTFLGFSSSVLSSSLMFLFLFAFVEKIRTTSSFVTPVCQSVHPHERSQLLLGEFS